MPKGTRRTFAVLMGDLVDSELASDPEQLHHQFNEAINRQNEKSRDKLASPLTITLGDEFQGLTSTLQAAWFITRDLRIALLTREIDCRFSIGVTQLKTPLNPERAWNMMGPGLAQTRDRLNERRSYTRYNFVFPDNPELERLLEALGGGLTTIEKQWTKRQAEVINGFMEGASATQIARLRNVSAHSVYKVRSSGDFDAYLLQWSAIGEALGRLDQNYGMS